MQIDKNDPNFAYIIPYRETKTNEKEFLFYKKSENDSFTSFSGKIIETDPTPLFSASRIMLSILYDYKLEILEKQNNWTDPFYLSYLEIISEFDDYLRINSSIFFFINVSTLFPKPTSLILSYLCICDISDVLISESITKYIEMSKKPKDLYVILQCEPSDKWIGIYEALYQNYLRQPCEKWLSFKIGKLEFPSEDIINNTKGWIITGSAAATYDKTLQWMQPLFNLIQKIYFENKGKILGFCFGHQAIAKALGGDTEKMNLSIEKPYLLHKNYVKFNQNINTKKFYTKNKFFDYNQGVFLNQSHGDHVYLVPKNGEILAFSDDTKIEMFSIEENVLGIQSHPEFCDVMMKLRLLFLHSSKEEKWIEFVRNSFLNKQLDNHQVMNMCIDFLKN